MAPLRPRRIAGDDASLGVNVWRGFVRWGGFVGSMALTMFLFDGRCAGADGAGIAGWKRFLQRLIEQGVDPLAGGAVRRGIGLLRSWRHGSVPLIGSRDCVHGAGSAGHFQLRYRRQRKPDALVCWSAPTDAVIDDEDVHVVLSRLFSTIAANGYAGVNRRRRLDRTR